MSHRLMHDTKWVNVPCTLYTYVDEGSFQSAKERHKIIIKKEMEGIEISIGNENEARTEILF